MVQADASTIKQVQRLKAHLENETPLLVDLLGGFERLDKVGYRTGLLNSDESYAAKIPWWPLVSILGVFSAGKSSFINSYLRKDLQKTGNQAVDDKFTVICFGQEQDGKVLPGLALDADMRFPFYRISNELEKVSTGEGRRIDAYLQLKVTDSPKLRGKILIDSPGFDADDQRSATLRLTNHIMDISDLVLVFFDARHPEPGAMQDTLKHLVEKTIERADSNKFLFILNQMDSAAREDNSEDIVGAWQRALSAKGLTTGRFYTIYNKDVAPSIEDEAARTRFSNKCDADMAEIESRIDQIDAERAYRVVGALEKEAYHIQNIAVPAIVRLKKSFARKVWRMDLLILVLIILLIMLAGFFFGVIGSLATFVFSLLANPVSMLGSIAVLGACAIGVHFFVRHSVAQRMLRQMQETEDKRYEKAFRSNTRFFRTLFRTSPVGWTKSSKRATTDALDHASEFVQKLNDQHAKPSG